MLKINGQTMICYESALASEIGSQSSPAMNYLYNLEHLTSLEASQSLLLFHRQRPVQTPIICHTSYCNNCLPNLTLPHTASHRSLLETLQWTVIAVKIKFSIRPWVYQMACAIRFISRFISGYPNTYFILKRAWTSLTSSISLYQRSSFCQEHASSFTVF